MSKQLLPEQIEDLINTLKERFKKNMKRHEGIAWEDVESKLRAAAPSKLWSLDEMEVTGGEPDVIGYDNGIYVFCDCAPETPKGRRSLCYDRKALDARKMHKPENSAMDVASEMGVEILTEEQYRDLQTLGKFDQKTSTWLKTPKDIRDLGGAIFGDFRYGKVFIYHNGADSYYGSRAFRGILKI
ncbi:MAG: DUF4256 domain-containing protein [Pedobacter sp.]|nr:MAG: DUF4256 domain-containing protein [Pedobacter sp.]